jgi:hypothetical protein
MIRPGVDPEDKPRLDSQCDRILARLKTGPATNVELAGISLKYTSRLSDLRRLGHAITCEKRANGVSVYRLVPRRETPTTQMEIFG